jgi:hypothetical protein
MLLLIAFACFFVLMMAWLMMPTIGEHKAVVTESQPAPRGTANLQTQV